MSQIIYNPKSYSRDSGMDGFRYENLVLRAVNANWNDDGWNVNANSVENMNSWNEGNRVFSRNSCISPAYTAGVLLSMPRFHA